MSRQQPELNFFLAFATLFNSKAHSDVTIICENNQVINAHCNILSLRTPFFHSAINFAAASTDGAERGPGKVSLTDYKYMTVYRVVKWCYTGLLDLTKSEHHGEQDREYFQRCIHVYFLADFLGMDDLMSEAARRYKRMWTQILSSELEAMSVTVPRASQFWQLTVEVFENTAEREEGDNLRGKVGWLIVEFRDELLGDEPEAFEMFTNHIKEVDGLATVIALDYVYGIHLPGSRSMAIAGR